MPCDVFVDTMGVGFAYPWIAWVFGLPIYSYTHYPLVSSDMLKDVESEEEQFNNKAKGSQKDLKVYYYKALILLYRFCGKYADQVAANSSWTRGHMNELWGKSKEKIETIYPPCDTSEFMERISLETPRKNLVISFAQFRPEKQHRL